MPRGNNKKFIGVFDSGFGGINILRGIVKELPKYNYIYLGDTARAPYGSRSKETIFNFTSESVNFLFKNNCKLVILACNTASSDALRKIQQEYLPKLNFGKKVLGVLIPAAEHAATVTKNRRIGVIATEGTIKSGAFIRELNKICPEIKIFQNACPLLVPIIEAGEQDSKFIDLILQKYLNPLVSKNIDTLILGCTHYGILENKIRKIIGKKIIIVSEDKVVPLKLRDYLKRHKNIEKEIGKNGIVKFYSTDLTDRFRVLGSKFFGRKINPEKVAGL